LELIADVLGQLVLKLIQGESYPRWEMLDSRLPIGTHSTEPGRNTILKGFESSTFQVTQGSGLCRDAVHRLGINSHESLKRDL